MISKLYFSPPHVPSHAYLKIRMRSAIIISLKTWTKLVLCSNMIMSNYGLELQATSCRYYFTWGFWGPYTVLVNVQGSPCHDYDEIWLDAANNTLIVCGFGHVHNASRALQILSLDIEGGDHAHLTTVDSLLTHTCRWTAQTMGYEGSWALRGMLKIENKISR